MKCPKCGNEINPDQRFCTKCGQPTNQTNDQYTPKPLKVPTPQRVNNPLNDPEPMESKGLGARFRAARQGWSRQADKEDEVHALLPFVEFKIKDGEKLLEKLKRKYKEKVTYEDESLILDCIEKLKKIKETISDTTSPQTIRKALSHLERALYDLETKLGEPHTTDGGEQENNRRDRGEEVSVMDLEDMNEDEFAVVRGKAIWGIQSGQLARRISERELVTASEMDGFIIQHGCSAMIFVNGELIDIFESGAYSVPSKNEQRLKEEYNKIFETLQKEWEETEKREKEAEEKRRQNASIAERGGLVGITGAAIRKCWEFVFGARHLSRDSNKSKEEERLFKLKKETEKILKKRYPDPLLHVILVSNRAVTLTFGGEVSNTGITFKPYYIPTKLFDVSIGVELQVVVSDISVFTTNYLADKHTFTSIHAFELIDGSLRNLLYSAIRNVDYTREGLSDEMQESLRHQIQEMINRQLYGLACDKVLSITDKSEDFDHFRERERELYKTDKELDYLARTGELKNRFEQTSNQQLINSAQNEEELRYALQQINKDQLLHDDELEGFVLLLWKQKQIRTATTQEEVFEALQDLQKSNLVKQDEVEAVKDALLHNKIDRDKITDIMRAQSIYSVELERLNAEWSIGDKKSDHDWEREVLDIKRSWGIEDEYLERKWKNDEMNLQHELQNRRQQDQYNDERDEHDYNQSFVRRKNEDDYDFSRDQRQRDADWQHHTREEQERRENASTEYARSRQDKFDDSDLLNRNADEAKNRLLDIQESERKTELQKMSHEENIHSQDVSLEKEKVNAYSAMSADQLAALNLSQMSAEAQVEFSRSLGTSKETDLLEKQKMEQNELYQQMLKMQQEQSKASQDAMMKMSQMMKEGMMGVGQQQAMTQQQILSQQQQYQEEKLKDQMQMKEEYRENMMHQQQRMDQTQEVALDNIGQVSSAAASNLSAFNGGFSEAPMVESQISPKQQEMFPCPYCGKPVAAWQTPCPHCNNEIKWE